MTARWPTNRDLALIQYPLVGRRSSDRPRIEDRPPLRVKALMEVVDALAKSRGMTEARVAYKTNGKGEHVVAIIWPPQGG